MEPSNFQIEIRIEIADFFYYCRNVQMCFLKEEERL